MTPRQRTAVLLGAAAVVAYLYLRRQAAAGNPRAAAVAGYLADGSLATGHEAIDGVVGTLGANVRVLNRLFGTPGGG